MGHRGLQEHLEKQVKMENLELLGKRVKMECQVKMGERVTKEKPEQLEEMAVMGRKGTVVLLGLRDLLVLQDLLDCLAASVLLGRLCM